MKKTVAFILFMFLCWPILVLSSSGSGTGCDSTPVSVALFAPNGGQTLDPGTFYDITRSATGSSLVRISLSIDGGLTFPILITESSASSVIYSWEVNDVDTDQARIIVEALDICGNAVASDISDNDFSINGTEVISLPVEPVVVTVSTPVAGDSVSGTVLMQAMTDVAVSSLDFDLSASGVGTLPVVVGAISDSEGKIWTGFWDSTLSSNGTYSLTAKASDGEGVISESETMGLIVDNIILPIINVGVTEPQANDVLSDFIQITALTDLEADALDFIIKPKSATSSSEPAVIYGLTGTNHLLWTTSFDTRKYANGQYLVKAKVYLFGAVVGESQEVEVSFDNPETSNISVVLSAPENNAIATGTVALMARTSVRAGALDFVITADSSAGGDAEPIIIKATPDLEKKKWTSLWESFDVTNGSYGLKAKAYVGGLLAGESQMQALTVFNSLILVGVDLLAPTHDSSISGTVSLVANVSEAVEKVDFMILADDAPVGALATVLTATVSLGNLEWTSSWDTLLELDGRYHIWARAWYQGRSVGESAVASVHIFNQVTGATAAAGFNLAETVAPEIDPNQEGEYGSQEAVSATPTINMDQGLLEPADGSYLLPPGTLFKSAAAAAVYYYGRDGKRYIFPDVKTYFTWYGNFNNVKTISAEVVATILLGGNVTYRPGVRMVKIVSDPKVYAVARGGVLRWVKSEVVARRLYGTNWNKMINDVSDAFFFNYTIGDSIEE